MSQYIDFRCGPYRLLLALGHVVEISDAPAGAGEGNATRRAWRDRTLRLCNLTAYLGGQPAERCLQVVLRGEEDKLEIIDVDAVLGLCEIDATAFVTIAGLAPSLQALADAVSPDPEDGACRLRLRHPFAWNAGGTCP